jgi:hypothetical protein
MSFREDTDFCVSHGYIRFQDGSITEFDVPGAGTGPRQGTMPEVFNLKGLVSGPYIDSNNVAHGFLRFPYGSIATFDARVQAPAVAREPFRAVSTLRGTSADII